MFQIPVSGSHETKVFENSHDVVSGLLCDLLWSDPDKDITGWSENDRGVSFTFGPDVVSRFLQKHDMDLICRAHQVSRVHPNLKGALTHESCCLSPVFDI